MGASGDGSGRMVRRSFGGATPAAARAAASAWLSDFSQHGPCHIRSIRVVEDQDGFFAVLTFSEMAIEETPRYFDQAAPLRKSA